MRLCRLLTSVFFALSIAIVAGAHGPPPETIPILRLLANVSTYIKAHPKDSNAYYTLGRTHYFAFTAPYPKPDGTSDAILLRVRSGGADSLPYFFNGWGENQPGKTSVPIQGSYSRSDADQLMHVRSAVTNLQKAITLRDRLTGKRGEEDYSPANTPGLFELSMACAFEDGARFAPKVGTVAGIVLQATPEAWLGKAKSLYLLAYIRSRSTKEENWRVSVVHEAGTSYLRLLKASPEKSDKKAIQESESIAQYLKKIEAIPYPVTPIVFRLTSSPSLSDLLTPKHQVRFDFLGTGKAVSCPWVQPDTAILVWDPDHTGKVTSGRQFFGSVTWWLFWEDGYAALAALDNDHDGVLRDTELAGLALWFDRNSNGISEPNEVVPIEDTPIVALSVSATGKEGASPMNTEGLRLKDGTVLPIWDWTLTVFP